MATPLHNHTHYSALDGLAKPADIAERCKDLNYHACCVTDHNVVAGHYDFYTEMRKNDIKPLLGIETYQSFGPRQMNQGARRDKDGNKIDNFHLILIAMNNTGLANLWRMNTESHRSGFYYEGRVDWDLLKKYNEGILATSACGLSLINQALMGNPVLQSPDWYLDRYQDIFGDRFFMEVSTYSGEWVELYNTDAVALARTRSVPLVYANDAHYAAPEQYDLHETVLCMQYREKMSQRQEPHHTPDLYIMGEKEIEQRLAYLGRSAVDEAMENTDDIAAMCNVTFDEDSKHIPVFVPDKEYKNSKDMIFDLAVKGYEKKIVEYGHGDEDYMPRFESEMKVIFDANLVDYFLSVYDFIKFAKEKGIPVGPGRGSVGGSLIAYLLGITEIDPIQYDLMFERFYNAGRIGKPPDIDVDFSVAGRQVVKDYIAKKYGEAYVADIGAVSEMQGKGAITKLGTAMEIPIPDVRKISNMIDKAIESGQQPDWEKIYEECGDDLQVFKKKYPQLFEDAEALYKHIHTYTVHPSGVLVSDVELEGVFPLRWHANDKKMVTQWDMRTAEKLGFMKHDILGLRNLDTLDEANTILKELGQDIVEYEKLQHMTHPDEMYKLLEDGLTVGIFQIEDGAQPKSLCRKIKPRSVEDIGLITALNRPGPLKSGAAIRYIKKRNGEDVPARYGAIAEGLLEQAAQETFGELVYQEQLIRFFTLLGCDPLEADEMREIIGKKKRDKMADAKAKYLERANKAGISKDAERIWKDIEPFADYAFNKAHSISYGIIALYTLYVKYYHPTAFILAAMRTVDKKQKHRYIKEAKRMNIKILSPSLDESDIGTTIVGDAIRYGFSDIKGIGKEPARWLVQHRPFTSFEEIIDKAVLPENKKTLPTGIKKMVIDRGQVEALKKLSELEGPDLFELEEELLGVALSDNTATILDDYSEEIAAECVPLESIDEMGEFTVAAIITDITHSKTRKGEPMARVTLSDGIAERTVAVWNSQLKALRFVWQRRTAVVAQIKTGPSGSQINSARILHPKRLNDGSSLRKVQEEIRG